MAYAPLANLDLDATLDLVRSGVLMKTIAEPLGVSAEAIRKRLLQHPDYANAIKEQAASLVEKATDYCFDESLTPLQVGIARVRLDAAHKYAAARDPATWGNKSQLSLPTSADGAPTTLSIVFVQHVAQQQLPSVGSAPLPGRVIEQDK